MGYSARETYSGTRLKAEDLEGKQPVILQILGVELVTFEDRETGKNKKMFELSFMGTDKTLTVNFTNASLLADLYGDDTEGWIGKGVCLFWHRVTFGQKLVGSIGMRSVLEEKTRRQIEANMAAHGASAAGQVAYQPAERMEQPDPFRHESVPRPSVDRTAELNDALARVSKMEPRTADPFENFDRPAERVVDEDLDDIPF
jgi:hypothetical protein